MDDVGVFQIFEVAPQVVGVRFFDSDGRPTGREYVIKMLTWLFDDPGKQHLEHDWSTSFRSDWDNGGNVVSRLAIRESALQHGLVFVLTDSRTDLDTLYVPDSDDRFTRHLVQVLDDESIRYPQRRALYRSMLDAEIRNRIFSRMKEK